ncbi:hypothetical protein BDV59DRAFT_186940, partial [Aspergillus ambiguus]|uniref:uncharacterized protein n=1 Tax=Aspergillus ambiguus TaxID=176160 RepID=UPI003CCDB12D
MTLPLALGEAALVAVTALESEAAVAATALKSLNHFGITRVGVAPAIIWAGLNLAYSSSLSANIRTSTTLQKDELIRKYKPKGCYKLFYSSPSSLLPSIIFIFLQMDQQIMLTILPILMATAIKEYSIMLSGSGSGSNLLII